MEYVYNIYVLNIVCTYVNVNATVIDSGKNIILNEIYKTCLVTELN